MTVGCHTIINTNTNTNTNTYSFYHYYASSAAVVPGWHSCVRFAIAMWNSKDPTQPVFRHMSLLLLLLLFEFWCVYYYRG